jgi:hypothetical protein
MTPGRATVEWLIVAAGLGQIALVAASLSIPRLLHWKEQAALLRPLTRQVFTTYAYYIVGTNLSFALISVLAPGWLLEGSGLGACVTGFMALYWGARVAVQFLYYNRRDAPAGALFRIAEAALVLLFLFLTVTYGLSLAYNLRES